MRPDRWPGSDPASRIPAFVNPLSGSARDAILALEQAGGFDVQTVRPEHLRERITAAVATGVERVLVAGGDGTVESAASVLAGMFINTSSVGAYVRFVRWRDRIEPYLGYEIASMLAGVRVLLRLPLLPVTLQVEGIVSHYRTPLVFVGVGERHLALAGLGQRVPGGNRGLHVILPRGRRQARHFARAYGRLTRGLPVEERKIGLDTALVKQFRLDLPGRRTHIATDGEIVPTDTPLAYRCVPDALRVIVPGMAAAGYAETGRDAR